MDAVDFPQLHKDKKSGEKGFPLLGSNYIKFLNWANELETFSDTVEGKFQAKVVSVLICKLRVSSVLICAA